MKRSFRDIHTASKAFSLIEVVMALGICSFCLIALIGLLSQGLSTNRDTVSETEAAGIARMVQSDLAAREVADATGKLKPTTSRFGITVPAAPSSATTAPAKTFFLKADGSDGSSIDSIYRVDVSFGASASAVSAIALYILVTWPSGANPSAGNWPKKPVGSFEVATAINP